MKVWGASAGVKRENTGHHNLLVNLESMPDLTQPLLASEQIRHFGGGQAETGLKLAPGDYTLQLLLGDAQHVPHQSALMFDVIKVTVK